MRAKNNRSSTPQQAPANRHRNRRVLLAMDFYLYQVHRGVVDFARQAGWMLDSRPVYAHALPEEWSADGILTFIGSEDKHGPELRASGLPIVNMSPYKPELGLPSVQLDNRKAGELAAEHLIGRGFGHLSMVQFWASSPTSAARCAGFKSAISAAARNFYPMVCPQSYAEGSKVLLDWVARELIKLPKPLGLLAEGDGWAVEFIHMCRKIGLEVPDQVGILGFDNDPLMVDVAPVPLSSVDNDLRGLGFRAAELLDQILAGMPPPAEPILIPPIGLVQRQSTNTLAVDQPELLAAVKYIQAHFAEPINVEDVADHSQTSRRRLQDLFSMHLRRTISQEILRCRLDLAQRLLRETGLKINPIAERAGFGNAVQMTKVFARELGTGPAHYRQMHMGR